MPSLGTFLPLLIVAALAASGKKHQHGNVLRQTPVQPGAGNLVNTKVCANSGTFLNSYCMDDYNCNPGNKGEAQCIRALCCARTMVRKTDANVRTQEDQSCINGGFLMSVTKCSHSEECNEDDPDRQARGYSVITCTSNGYCCSKPYSRPISDGDRCLNGGRFIAGSPECRVDADCVGANLSPMVGRTSPMVMRATVCVESSCCTLPSAHGSSSSGSSSSSSSSEEHEQFQRGRSACFSYGEFTGEICAQPAECGLSDPQRTAANYVCVSGYCCADRSLLPGGNAGGLDYTQGDELCGFRGIYLKKKCHAARDCPLPQNRDPTIRHLCINEHCCAISIRQTQGETPIGIGGNACSSSIYRRFIVSGCAITADCPITYDNGVAIGPVQCVGGNCCAMEIGLVGAPNSGGISLSSSSEMGLPGVGATFSGWSLRPTGSGAICYDGTPTSHECRALTECPPDLTCMNNLCCPKHPDERLFACGGLATNGNCFPNSQCGNNLYCTASGLCCECRFGRPQAGGIDCRANGGQCSPGFYCNSGGYCCPRCPGGDAPFGSCYRGECGSGFVCQPGNICCNAQPSQHIGWLPG